MSDSVVVPADQAHELTGAVWSAVLEDPPAPWPESAELRRIIRGSDNPARENELRAFVNQLSRLDIAGQRAFVPAIDDIQVRSKLWLIDELSSRRDLLGATLVVLGAWVGVLPLLLNWRLERLPTRMICVDINAEACALGAQVIGALYPNVEYQVADALDLDYPALASEPGSVVINTICEHLADAETWWARVSPGQLTVLQSNNYEPCRDHVNCVQNLQEMKTQTPLAEPWYEGVLPLSLFDRFMLIGRR